MKVIKFIVLLVVTAISPALFVRQAVKLTAEKAENAKNMAAVKADSIIIDTQKQVIKTQQKLIDTLTGELKGRFYNNKAH